MKNIINKDRRMAMKHEWRKQEKRYYIPKQKPELIEIPPFKFIQLKGEGNPNNDAFSEAIGVLYSLAYAIRMMPKNGFIPEGYEEYVVYPLEGVWDLKEEARNQDTLDKDALVYTIMIRQPEFVTEEVFQEALRRVKQKKPHPLLDEVEFVTIEEGMCVQMMHVGSFDDEKYSFDLMKQYCEENQLNIRSQVHREIYISDFRKTAPEKLKTVLRYRIRKEE